MKKWKRLFLVLVVCSFLFITACSGSAVNSGSNNGGDGDDTIKLGFILSLSGNFAQMGTPVKEGIEMYFEENPEIDGKKVKLYFEDDAGDPQTALRKYEQLVMNQGVHIIGGGTIGSIALALRDKADSDKTVPFINLVGSSDGMSWENKSDYVWRTSWTSWQYASIAGKYTSEVIGKESVIVASDYVAGHEIVTNYVANFEESGGTVKNVIWVPLGTSDFSSYLTQIENANPKAVVMFIPGADGSRFIKQFQEFGLKDKYALVETGALLNSPANIDAVGKAVVGANQVTNYFHELDNELNNRFVKAYQEKYNKLPDSYSVSGYDSGELVSQIIQKTGSTDSERILSVLDEGVTLNSPRGPLKMDPVTQTLTQNMYVTEGKEVDGKYVFELVKTYENVEMPDEDLNYKKY